MLNLKIKRKKIIENLINIKFWIKTTTVQDNNIKKSANIGLKKNKSKLALYGCTISFKKSLIASLKGWNTPIKNTLLGPFRACLNLKTFRSKRVTKATLISTGIKRKKFCQIKLKITFNNLYF